MEEKERYQLERPNGTFSEIHDTKLDVWYSNRQPITELLNKQDKHIKELEAQEKFNFDYRDRCQLEEYQRWADKEITKLNNQNKQLKKQISKMEETLGRIMSGEYIPANIVDKSLKLSKQSQKQLAIEEFEKLKSQPLEIVEKIKKELEMNGDSYCEIRKCNSSHTNHQYAWFNYVAFEEFLTTMLKEYQKEVK